MIFIRLRIVFTFALFFQIFGCSTSNSNFNNSSKAEYIEVKPVEEIFLTDGSNIDIPDTINTKRNITSKLELARQHYQAALDAFDNDDSTLASDEFESAIKILDELSYYPEIEKNDEFNELSKSLVEDYEKLISSIDELDPDAPIFALRQKINSEAELIDVKKEKIILPKEIPNTTVQMEINERVEQFIAFFLDRGYKFLPKWFYRSGIYFPMMKRIFAEEGLPQELIYLSLVESGLNPTARSWASAVGLWQFIKGTGELYGLNGNIWYDDRRNPEKATRAAARHLKDLFDIYQDWHLALAAYNCGGGRVNYALRKSKSDTFWDIYRHLPKETRGYVPQYIAISLIFMNPKQYGFDKYEIGKPFECDTVNIHESVDLSVIAECIGISEEEITYMNPELVQSCTPPNTVYPIKIPKDKVSVFAANFKNIPPEKKRSFFLHIVKRGETQSSIAKKYGISKSLLASINNLSSAQTKKRSRRRKSGLPVGIALKIPMRYSPDNLAMIEKQINGNDNENGIEESETDKINGKKDTKSSKTKLIYIAKSNDNLKKIAMLYDVRISDLRNWNDISFGDEVHESDSIEIWVPDHKLKLYKDIDGLTIIEKEKLLSTKFTPNVEKEYKWINHKIRKGESLGAIADDYNVTVKSLKKWNKLRNSTVLIGQNLKIYAKVPVSNLADKKSNEKNAVTKDLTWTVKEGETLFSIAKKHGIPLKDLKTWNNIDEKNSIKTGQVLRLIPRLQEPDLAAREEKTSKKTNNQNYQSYKVKKGDNLYSIASAYNVSIEDIKSLNKLSNEKIKSGQKLKINSSTPSSSKGDNSKSKTSLRKESYKVKSGDTFYSISKKFGVKIDDLKKWNKPVKNLKAGEKIIIYK